MAKGSTKILSKDCSQFIYTDLSVIPEIISCFEESNVFQTKKREKEIDPVISYNYKKKQWETARYVGDLYFESNKKSYHLKIEPRFGNVFLLNLFEGAFNIKIPKSNSDFKKSFNSDLWIKSLFSFIWIQKLSKANKHGLPHKQNKIEHFQSKIKGRLDINKSKISLHTTSKVFSTSSNKVPDLVVVQILKKAYQILENEYHLKTYKSTPKNALDAIQNLNALPKQYSLITKTNFHKIRFKDIYSSYNEIVNLSWLIIQNKLLSNKNIENQEKKGFSAFLDIAELWELYLLNILKKALGEKGWKVYSKEFVIYEHKAFQRKIIPDIIIEKDNNVLIFDAKYKRMEFDYFDYDRSDFFQIHTYTFFKSVGKKIVCAGLLYPLSKTFETSIINKNTDSIFGNKNENIIFKVDGIDYSELNKEQSFEDQMKIIKLKEFEFINRILDLTSNY